MEDILHQWMEDIPWNKPMEFLQCFIGIPWNPKSYPAWCRIYSLAGSGTGSLQCRAVLWAAGP